MFRIPTPIVLLLGLIVATCFIAYWADQLGMKLGKKRISLFGLRPRQTATLLSIISSLGIMIFTLLVMLIAYPPLKDALLRYDRVNERNRQLLAENTNLDNNLKAQKEALARQTIRIQELAKRLRGNTQRLSKLRMAIAQRQREVKNAQDDLNRATSELNNANAARNAAVEAQRTAQQREAAARQGEAQARERGAQAQAQARETTAKLREANGNLQTANTRLQQAQREFERAQAELEKRQQELSRTRNQLVEQRQNLHRARNDAQEAQKQSAKYLRLATSASEQVAQATREVQDKQTQVQSLNNQLQQLEVGLEFVRAQLLEANEILVNPDRIGIRVYQLFDSVIIPAKENETTVRAQLQDLVVRGDKVVRELGAETLVVPTLSANLNGQEVVVPEEQIIPTLARILTTYTTPVLVRLVAGRDHSREEKQVQGRFLMTAVKPVFTAGQIITEGDVKVTQVGAAGDAQIFNQLLALTDKGRSIAERLGVEPLMSQQSPNFYASDTNLRIFEALREVQNRGEESSTSTLHVRLVAAADLTTIDPLRVRLEVE